MGFGFEKYLETLAIYLMDVATVVLYCDSSVRRHLDHCVRSVPFAPELSFPEQFDSRVEEQDFVADLEFFM